MDKTRQDERQGMSRQGKRHDMSRRGKDIRRSGRFHNPIGGFVRALNSPSSRPLLSLDACACLRLRRCLCERQVWCRVVWGGVVQCGVMQGILLWRVRDEPNLRQNRWTIRILLEVLNWLRRLGNNFHVCIYVKSHSQSMKRTFAASQ